MYGRLQVGFTTDPAYSRSTPYCTDLGKAFDVPIFHCNGDDPLSVTTAFEMATDWRQVRLPPDSPTS
jgi:2-oxoglutarate dehydrogenase E1 component